MAFAHRGRLRERGPVVAEPRWRFSCYQLSDERVEQFLRLGDELLADVAKGVYECTRYNAEESDHG